MLEETPPPTSTVPLDEWLAQTRDGYNDDQLRAALDLVVDPENWKMPIDAVVTAEIEPRQITAAVVYYCGCSPDIETLPNGGLHVTAPGYYLAVGS